VLSRMSVSSWSGEVFTFAMYMGGFERRLCARSHEICAVAHAPLVCAVYAPDHQRRALARASQTPTKTRNDNDREHVHRSWRNTTTSRRRVLPPSASLRNGGSSPRTTTTWSSAIRLEVKLSGGSFTQAGLKLSSVQTTEQKVEANTNI
jgi:hypothetical protein